MNFHEPELQICLPFSKADTFSMPTAEGTIHKVHPAVFHEHLNYMFNLRTHMVSPVYVVTLFLELKCTEMASTQHSLS